MKETILEIQDEVNCRFHNLDVSTRRKLSNAVKFILPYARHTPAVKLGHWDGSIRFCDIGARTYINVLDRLLPIVERAGYQVALVDHRESHEFEFEAIDGNSYSHIHWPEGHRFAGESIQVMDHQVNAVNTYLEHPQSIQCISTAAGKCQPYDSKVLTQKGWRDMGDIQVGDTVITPAGKPSKVLATFEPGTKQVYEIELKDGRRVRACGDHLWPVYDINWKKSKSDPVRWLSTTAIMEHMTKSQRPIGIPLVTMDHDSIDIDLPMDPWLLGFLLGGGGFRHGSLGFSTADREICDRIQSLLHEDYRLKHKGKYDYHIQFADRALSRKRHGENISRLKRDHRGHIQESGTSANIYIQTLIDLGLYGKLSHEKFVPEIYFRGSKRQRLEIIRGLVDSDGTIDKKSVCFSSSSFQLARDFQRLIHSVGGIASLGTKTNRTYTYQGEKRPARDNHSVRARYPSPQDLTWLPRKQQLCGSPYQYGPTLKNQIMSVTPVGEMPVKCILIDDPSHLYVTDDYVMTHNTLITAILSHRVELAAGGRTIVIVPSQDLVTQTEESYRLLELDVGVFYGGRKDYDRTHTICTWQSLEVLNKKSKKYDPDFDIDTFIAGVSCVMVDECFDGSTPVLTPSGYVPIRDIRSGDKIINRDDDTGYFKTDIVVKSHENLTVSDGEDMLELQFGNGVNIKVTANHKFLTDRGWVRADHLTAEDVIVDHDPSKLIQDKTPASARDQHQFTVANHTWAPHSFRLINKQKVQKPQTVYNLHIRDHHNYVAAGAVVANCHSAKAEVLKRLMTTVFARVPIRWGMTGTIPREEVDQVALGVTIGSVTNTVAAAELQEKGILSNLHIDIMQLDDPPWRFRSYAAESSALATDSDRLDWLVNHIHTTRQSGNTLILVSRLETGKYLAEHIPGSVFVSGSMKSRDRKSEYREVGDSSDKVIIATYGVASVGIDIPRIFNLYLFEAGKSFIRVIQSIGRGIRRAADKDFVQVFDICGTTKYSKKHLTERKRYYREQDYPFQVRRTRYLQGDTGFDSK